jgi:glutamyl-tRNA synthetase/glutamyl-Q tRNA(Asp) synthetase
MPAAPVTRFAPAPTGLLHLGHVFNAIHVWGIARAHGGRVLLRIEDHDRQRSRPEFERAIVDDLAWLGFEADAPLVRQSDRTSVYESAVGELRRRGLIYACDCSRREIAGATVEGDELRYPGTCAGRGLPERDGVGLRVRLDRSVERFHDLRHGPLAQSPADQCGDLLVRDREGNWTYQFAAAVDDFDQGVTLVVRGDDLLGSTGRQIQVARLLGRTTPPTFVHHALIMKSPTQKLSKSDGDTGVADLRRAGCRPESVIGRAAARGRLIEAARDIRAEEVPELFTGGLPRRFN